MLEDVGTVAELIDTRLDSCSAQSPTYLVAAGAAVFMFRGATGILRNVSIANSVTRSDSGISLAGNDGEPPPILDAALLTVETCSPALPPLGITAFGLTYDDKDFYFARVRGLRATLKPGCPTPELAMTSAALTGDLAPLPTCASMPDSCGTLAICRDSLIAPGLMNVTTPYCECNASAFEKPFPSAIYSESLAPFDLGCTSPRVGVGVGIRALKVTDVLFTLRKPDTGSRVLTLKMGGTAKDNATWSIAASTVPLWLHLDSLHGEYTSVEDEAEIVQLTAVTVGLHEKYENYEAVLQLVVTSDIEHVFSVPVLLQLSVMDDAALGTWGAIPAPAFEGASRPSCTSHPAVATAVVVEVEARFHFTSCDAEAMPVAHSLPSTEDARAFAASVRSIGDATAVTVPVVPQTFGVYYVPFSPPVLGTYVVSVSLAGEMRCPSPRTVLLARLPGP